MEAGAAFLLLLIVVFVAIVGGLVWLVASSLRRRKLNPQEDKIDRHMMGADGAPQSQEEEPPSQDGESQAQERPEHHRVTSEQGSRSIPQR